MDNLLKLAQAVKDAQEWLNPNSQDCVADAAESFEEGLRYLSLASDHADAFATELAEGGLSQLETSFRQVEADLESLCLTLQDGADQTQAIARLDEIMLPLKALLESQQAMEAALLEQWEGTLG